MCVSKYMSIRFTICILFNYTVGKNDTLKDYVHWHQAIIAYCAVLEIHWSRSSRSDGAQESCICAFVLTLQTVTVAL